MFWNCDVLELRIAVGMIAHRQRLVSLSLHKAELLEQRPEHTLARGGAFLAESATHLLERQIRPANLRPHRITSGVLTQHVEQILFELRHFLDQPCRVTPFFRTRSGTGSVGASKSSRPCRIVWGSQLNNRETYSTPP